MKTLEPTLRNVYSVSVWRHLYRVGRHSPIFTFKGEAIRLQRKLMWFIQELFVAQVLVNIAEVLRTGGFGRWGQDWLQDVGWEKRLESHLLFNFRPQK